MKVVVAGRAVVVTSSLKLEDIKKIKRFRPDALTLYGGEDEKEPVFRIGVTTRSNGSLNEYGAEFATEANDGSGLAVITMGVGDDVEDIRESVLDELGGALANLGKLELKLPAVLGEIDAERATISNSIEILA